MSDSMLVFDRRALRRQRSRRAASFADHDFLVREVADRLADRLRDVRRRFSTVLDLGCHQGQFSKLAPDGIDTLVQCDLAPAMVARATGLRLAADEEQLPFRDATFDLVVSVLGLHWVNDLPGTLVQIRRLLKPDGLLLAALIGGDSLTGLRQAFLEVESEREHGASPRVPPFVDVRDGGALLQRAGFALPVADVDPLTVRYPSPLALFDDLRGMAAANVMVRRRRRFSRRDTIAAAAARYAQKFADPEGGVSARFQILTLTGWRPHDSQQAPLRPGSASHSLAEALAGAKQRR